MLLKRVAVIQSQLFVNKIFALVCAASVIWSGFQATHAQVTMGSSTQWLQGRQLAKNQAAPVSASWTQSPIREQLSQFSIQRKRPIFLDRRVDPTTQLTLQFSNQTTDQIAWATASSQGLGVVRVGDLLYVGPKESAARLPWVIKRVRKSLSSKDRKFWNSKTELRWEQATTTLQIANWFKSKGVNFHEAIPHDVWPAGDWPRLTLLEQMSLFLIGFDTDFEIAADGRTVKLLALKRIKDQTIKIRSPRDGSVDPAEIAQKISTLKVRRGGKMVSITGDVVSLLEFDALMVSAQNASVVPATEKTLTMTAEGRRRDILAEIAKQTGRELILSDIAARSLDEKIRVKLERATLEATLDACIDGSPLAYQADDKSLRIFVK